jgi:hypothetical protein
MNLPNPQDQYQALREQLEKLENRLKQMRSLSVWAVEAENIESITGDGLSQK